MSNLSPKLAAEVDRINAEFEKRMIGQKVIEENGRQRVVNFNYDPNPEASEARLYRDSFGNFKPIVFPSIGRKSSPEKPLENAKDTTSSLAVPAVSVSEAAGHFRCDARGYQIPCVGHRKTAHIITRQYKTIQGAAKNKLGLCQAHEIYFNSRDQKEWFRFVRKNFPEKFKWVKSKYHFILNEYTRFMEVADEH